jgi:hypothetical protein
MRSNGSGTLKTQETRETVLSIADPPVWEGATHSLIRFNPRFYEAPFSLHYPANSL